MLVKVAKVEVSLVETAQCRTTLERIIRVPQQPHVSGLQDHLRSTRKQYNKIVLLRKVFYVYAPRKNSTSKPVAIISGMVLETRYILIENYDNSHGRIKLENFCSLLTIIIDIHIGWRFHVRGQ